MSDGYRRVSVVGVQNSGKTLLLEQLVAVWKSRGLRVVVLKHDGHMDLSPGTDDWEKQNGDTVRLQQAGAIVTAVAGGGQSLVRITEDRSAKNLEDFAHHTVDMVRARGGGIDLVAAEGWKQSAWPKVAVVGSDEDVDFLMAQNLIEVRAFYTTRPLLKVAAIGPRVYHRADIERLADDVLAWT